MVAAHHRSAWVLTLFVLLGSLAFGMPARPAVAATLTVTALSCEAVRISFLCDGYVSGGTGSYTYTWSIPTKSRYDYPDHSTIIAYCSIGTWVGVTFSVRDSSGTTASKSTSVYCSGAPQ